MLRGILDTAMPLGMGLLAVKESPPESSLPEMGFAVFVLYVLWQVLDRHVLSKRSGSLDISSIREALKENSDSHAIHDRETTESLAILRAMKSKLDELIVILRERN